MALPSNPSLISADEYLNSSYRPDMEYVDGVLVERGMPTFAHGVLPLILGAYFRALMKEFRFVPASEARTRIVERARYRIPDIALWPRSVRLGKVMTVPPWVVIEILSPGDDTKVQIERFKEFRRIGVLHIVLLDPSDSGLSGSKTTRSSKPASANSNCRPAISPLTQTPFSGNSRNRWRTPSKRDPGRSERSRPIRAL